MDPLFEKHPDFSPNNYVLNNPLVLVDPDGRQVRFSTSSKSTFDGLSKRKKLGTAIGNRLENAWFTFESMRLYAIPKELVGAVGELSILLENPALDIGPLAVAGVIDDALKAGKTIRIAKTTGDIDKRTKRGKSLAKQAENLVSETKDVTQEFQKFIDTLEGGKKFAGSKEATNIADAFDVALKSKNIKQSSKNFFQKILDFFKKEEKTN